MSKIHLDRSLRYVRFKINRFCHILTSVDKIFSNFNFIQLLEKADEPYIPIDGDETPKSTRRQVQMAYNQYYRQIRLGC